MLTYEKWNKPAFFNFQSSNKKIQFISVLWRIQNLNKKCKKSTIFWDIMSCSPLTVNQCFRGTYRLHLPLKHRLTLKGLHGLVSQKMVLFITTAVRTSNPTRNVGGTCRLHLQGRRISQAGNQHEAGRWRPHVPPKHRLTLNGLHGESGEKQFPISKLN
jgi:hypothetical protein